MLWLGSMVVLFLILQLFRWGERRSRREALDVKAAVDRRLEVLRRTGR